MDGLYILIPLAPFLMVSFIVWTKHQSKMAELRIRDTAEKAAQYVSHTSELEERVRVLERIVTDKGYDVASQIEALRDTKKVEALLDSREKEVR
jgi:predicted ArsR family transcriptional regulator